MARNTLIIHSDIRSDLAVNPATDDLLLLTNENAVEQSIKNLLQTDFYERPFQPTLGSNIRSLLFELDTPQTAYNLKEAIIKTIENFEPRCQLIDVIIESDPDRNAYNCYITYNIIGDQGEFTTEFVLSRIR